MAYTLLDSTKLGTAGTTVEVTGLEQKDNLFVVCHFIDDGSSINPNLTFNGDNVASNSNYADRRNFNFATDGESTNFDFIEDLWNSDPFPVEVVMNIQNITTMEKIVMSNSCQANTAGSDTAPNSAVLMGKWINNVNAIDRITFTSTNNFAADSELVVYGT